LQALREKGNEKEHGTSTGSLQDDTKAPAFLLPAPTEVGADPLSPPALKASSPEEVAADVAATSEAVAAALSAAVPMAVPISETGGVATAAEGAAAASIAATAEGEVETHGGDALPEILGLKKGEVAKIETSEDNDAVNVKTDIKEENHTVTV
jgi:hypothetical protein